MALEHIEMRARNLRRRRDELGLTQEQVADRMHDAKRRRDPDGPPDKTTGQMVSDWERAINPPSDAKLDLLAEALKTTVADLSAPPPDKNGDTPDLLATFSESGDALPATGAPDSEKLDWLIRRQARLLAEIGKVQVALQIRQGTQQLPDTQTEASGNG